MVARQEFERGSTIIKEHPILLITPRMKEVRWPHLKVGSLSRNRNPLNWTPLQIKESKDLPLLQEFGRLSPEERKSALMLYDPGASYTKFDQIKDITEEERSFLRIVDVNAFGNSPKGNSGLYATICRINHSCAPNAYHIFDKQGVMEVGTIIMASLT